MNQTNVEEGSVAGDAKGTAAQPDRELRLYYARKRQITVRTVIFLVPLAAMFAVRGPSLGFALLLGGVCGIANMWLVMRANERLLEGKSAVGGHVASGFMRIGLFGALPVLVAARGPWWAMGIYFAGFFLPYVLYALELHRAYHRNAT